MFLVVFVECSADPAVFGPAPGLGEVLSFVQIYHFLEFQVGFSHPLEVILEQESITFRDVRGDSKGAGVVLAIVDKGGQNGATHSLLTTHLTIRTSSSAA
jgi:hypothetical protein